jgi:nitrogen fixation protein NifU and related proteins
MTPYGELVLDHSRHPRNYGSLDAPDLSSEGDNPFCGDRVRVELALSPDGAVQAARFQGDLCVIAKAAASLLTTTIIGMPLRAAGALDEEQFLTTLASPIRPARRSCALLALRVLQTGISHDRMP